MPVMKQRFTLFTLVLSLFSMVAAAQNGSVRGFVYEEESGEPVIFTNVYLVGTSLGAGTDVNGYFLISDVPAGDYQLRITYLGYDTLTKAVNIVPGRILNEKMFLKKSSINIQAVEISAQRQEAQTNVTISVTKATPKEIKQIPSIGGTPDLAQYLQVLPGVIFTGDQGGQLYIRGGSPVQNRTLMDGMTIINPFHSIGLFSVFDTELIRNADIYTAGFGAEYGGRVSSIMDIKMRDGNKRRITGKVGASTFLTNAIIEGPLKRQTNEGKSSSSFMFSAKHSYLDESSRLLYDYIDEEGLPFNFTDLYGKVSFNSSTGSKFSLFGFNYTDKVIFQEFSDLNWNSAGGGLNFVLVPQGNPVLVEGRFNYSDYQIELVQLPDPDDDSSNQAALRPRTSGISNFDLGINFKYFQGDNEFKYGVDISGFGTNFSFFNGVGLQFEQEENNTELGGFAAYKFKTGNLILDLGFRAQYYASVRVFRPEPRVGVKYNITPNFRIKAAGGLYSQNLISATSDRDVVNLFYGFLVAPDVNQDSFLEQDGSVREVKNPLQTAYHIIGGFEYDLSSRLTANVEVYLKEFTQLTNINRNKIFNSDNADAPDILKNDFVVESGDAKGIDFNLKYETRRWYVWAVYSLAIVNRWDGVREYNPVFDRRHNANFLVSYTWGKVRDWEVNARWNFGSGFPFTQNQGFFLGETFVDDISTDITQTNGTEPTIQYAELNGGRLPTYHRLDFSVKKTFNFSEFSKLEANFSLTNVYDRPNIFYVDRVTAQRVNQLPILPSVGLIFSF